MLGANLPGGIIVLEVNNIDYSLAEIAQIVEYNEAKVVSCCVTGGGDTNKVYVVLKVNTSNLEPITGDFQPIPVFDKNYLCKRRGIRRRVEGALWSIDEIYGDVKKHLIKFCR